MKLRQIALATEWTPGKIALVVGFVVVVFIFVTVREHINTKKGEKGEDIAKIRAVLKRLLPD